MPPGPTYPQYVRDRFVQAVVDEGIGAKRALGMAQRGELQGFDPGWPMPSNATTIRDWAQYEQRRRQESAVMDRERPVVDVIDNMVRRALWIVEKDLQRLENQGTGDVDYANMARMLEAVKKIAGMIDPRNKPPRADKKNEDEKINQSRVLEAVQRIQTASRAEPLHTQEQTTETGNAETHAAHNTTDQAEQDQANERGHLLQRAEALAAQAGAGKNGGSSG